MMKKMINRCLVVGLAVAFGITMGCEKKGSSAESMEKNVKAAKSTAVDAAACPVDAAKPAGSPESAIPKDHPAH